MDFEKKEDVMETDEDFKFVPLRVREPFASRDSNWLPLINLGSPTLVNDIASNFRTTFDMPMMSSQLNKNLAMPDLNVMRTYGGEEKSSGESSEGNLEDMFEGVGEEIYSYNNASNVYCENFMPVNQVDARDIDDLDDFEEAPHMQLIREIDLYTDNDVYQRGIDKQIDKIFKEIKEKNAYVISTLKAYKIPMPIIGVLVKKIIKTSIDDSKKEKK